MLLQKVTVCDRFIGILIAISILLVNFISLVTSCVGLQEEEPQTAHPMSFTWASHIAASMLMGR